MRTMGSSPSSCSSGSRSAKTAGMSITARSVLTTRSCARVRRRAVSVRRKLRLPSLGAAFLGRRISRFQKFEAAGGQKDISLSQIDEEGWSDTGAGCQQNLVTNTRLPPERVGLRHEIRRGRLSSFRPSLWCAWLASLFPPCCAQCTRHWPSMQPPGLVCRPAAPPWRSLCCLI